MILPNSVTELIFHIAIDVVIRFPFGMVYVRLFCQFRV
jgi:hypothetical protein